LIESHFANSEAVRLALDEHPGRDILDRLQSIESCLRLFLKSEATIQLQIQKFHVEAHTQQLLGRQRKAECKAIEDSIQENLYIFCACAMTLVDQARALSEKIEIPNYTEKVATFASDARHRFIQELRVDMVHVTIHDPSWQITTGRSNERGTKFLIRPKNLRRLKKYHSLAKEFVAAYPNGVDLGETVAQYRSDVLAFHDWLRQSVEAEAEADLTDLNRCWKIIRGHTARAFWRIIFQQVIIDAKKDAYAYLHKELTPAEIEQVMSMPHRTKRQVDQIINLADDDGICDDSLRNLAYQAFGVTDA
jgi:hypothetical protein